LQCRDLTTTSMATSIEEWEFKRRGYAGIWSGVRYRPPAALRRRLKMNKAPVTP